MHTDKNRTKTLLKFGPYILLAMVSSVLLCIAWSPDSYVWLIFLALVPIFILNEADENFKYAVPCKYLCFYLLIACWVGFTMFWMRSASVTALVILTLSVPFIYFMPFFFLRWYRTNRFLSVISFSLAWIVLEFLQGYWISGFPYLNLGQSLAYYPMLIQWYEITGALGGTVWILSINILVFFFINAALYKAVKLKRVAIAIALVALIPAAISTYRFYEYKEPNARARVISIHTDAFCRTYKYATTPELLLRDYMNITLPMLGEKPAYIFWPETALTGENYCDDLENNFLVRMIRDSICARNGSVVITGCVLRDIVRTNVNIPAPVNTEIRFNSYRKIWLKTYNAALYINPTDPISYRCKEKLVPFSERIPPYRIVKPIAKLIPSLGGMQFAHKDMDVDGFINPDDSVRIAPVICYESAFGEHVASIVKNGANLLAVILNEGWIGDYKYSTHLHYFSVVRAIENRRSIVRSSNDGISCFIDQRGITTDKVFGFESKGIRKEISVNNALTFYTIYGDYIGRISVGALCAIFLWQIVFVSIKRNNAGHRRGKPTNKVEENVSVA